MSSTCNKCGAQIDADSFFCDQCGAELMICPDCRIFCGKFCRQCGSPSVKASEFATASQPQSSTQPGPSSQTPPQYNPGTGSQNTQQPFQPAQQPVQSFNPSQSPQPAQTSGPSGHSTFIPNHPQRLVCHSMGISIPLQDHAIIGRVNGNFAHMLGNLQYLSGTHARLDRRDGKWYIIDLQSTNGTKVNGADCTPHVPVLLEKGAVVRFATVYDFNVE